MANAKCRMEDSAQDETFGVAYGDPLINCSAVRFDPVGGM